MFAQARFEIALDRAQGAGLQILACVNRTVVRHFPHSTRRCEPTCLTSTHPNSLRMRRKLRLVILSPLYRVPATYVKTTRQINSGPRPV